MPSIEYKIEIPNPQTHYAHVQIHIQQCDVKSLHFQMPVWTPGSYLVREFARNVQTAKASINGLEAPVLKTDKNTWKLDNTKGKDILFEYDIYAFEFSVRTSFIDADHAFLHNSSIFMMVSEYASSSGSIELHYSAEWKNLSTSLEKNKQGNLVFDNYDMLVDSPIEIGNHEVFSFDVMGVPHTAAMVGLNNCDMEKFKNDLRNMCNTMAQIIGEHPCKRYVFIIQNVESGGGGLEHLNSCCVVNQRWSWNNAEQYRNFLGLCAHEYFHLWNVKRLRPMELGPFDYNRENYTDMLWFSEGFTNYYDELALLRAGFVDRNAFVETLKTYINTLENRPGSSVQKLAESSRDAWIKEYRPNENSKNTTISYYSKGMVTAALLDAEICNKTNCKKNLDDVMRYLYQEYFKNKNRGFTTEEFVEALQTITGADFNEFIRKHVYSVEEPEYERIFSAAGIETKKTIIKEYSSGIQTALENGKTVVKYVNSRGPAWHGGINVNDILISANGAAINNDVDVVLKNIGNPGLVTFVLIRGGISREITMTMVPMEKIDFTLKLSSGGDNSREHILEKWLGKPKLEKENHGK